MPDPNLPGPGKRPRSSMSPTMVVDDGTLELVTGSPGGASIITTVAQVVLGHYERGLSIGDALAAPRLSSRNGATEQAEPAIATGRSGRASRRSATAGEHGGDRGGHGRPGARHGPLRRGGGAVPARGRLRDGGRPGGVTHLEHPEALARGEPGARHPEVALRPSAAGCPSRGCFCTTRCATPPAARRGSQVRSSVVEHRLADPDRRVGPDQVEPHGHPGCRRPSSARTPPAPARPRCAGRGRGPAR